MEVDRWIEFLNTVGATFWRGFPYDIAFFFSAIVGARLTPTKYQGYIMGIAIFMGVLIALNLAIGTIPAWLEKRTY